MTILKPQSGVPLLLGKQGEYNVTAVDFSDYLRSYAQEFGQGTLTVTHQRYEDDGPYAVPLTDGIWTVRETDLEYAGNGICELIYSFPNGTKKSTKWQTQVLTGLGQTIDPPEPWQAYIDRVIEAVASVENVVAGEAARKAAESARVSAESTRAARETARQQSENVRISAESNRNGAERNRVSQEAARVNAESARATAETARVATETARAATFSAVTAQATEAAANARQMAIAAEEAAETANAAAYDANAAATTARGEAYAASRAATDANAGAQRAQLAADAATRLANMAVSATTLPAGSEATVERIRRPSSEQLVFGIPQGKDGEVTTEAISAALGYMPANPAEVPTKAEVNAKADKSDIPDISGLATKTELENKADKSEIPDVSQLATKAEADELKSALTELDSTVVKTVNNTAPDENGNVNVQGGGGVDLDPTLTDPNKAAPANIVGELKNALTEITELDAKTIDGIRISTGGLDKSGNVVSSSGRRIFKFDVSELSDAEINIKTLSFALAAAHCEYAFYSSQFADVSSVGISTQINSSTVVGGVDIYSARTENEVLDVKKTVPVGANTLIVVMSASAVQAGYNPTISYANGMMLKSTLPLTEQMVDDVHEIVSAEMDNGDAYLMYAMDKVLCIGDSLTAGSSYYADGTWIGNIQQNYPYYLGRMLNCNVVNGGDGGESCLSWYNLHFGEYDFTKFNAVVIFLGTNGHFTDTLDADVNSKSSYNDYTANNTGTLCKMIEQIKEINFDCQIVLVNYYSSQSGADEGRVTLVKVAEKYGLPIVDTMDLATSGAGAIYHGRQGNVHLSKGGYMYLAKKICDAMVKWLSEDLTRVNFGRNRKTNDTDEETNGNVNW